MRFITHLKKSLLGGFLLTVFAGALVYAVSKDSTAPDSLTAQLKANSQTHYICTSPRAYAYHSRYNCNGLQKCTYDIQRVSPEQARSMHRKSCGICM